MMKVILSSILALLYANVWAASRIGPFGPITPSDREFSGTVAATNIISSGTITINSPSSASCLVVGSTFTVNCATGLTSVKDLTASGTVSAQHLHSSGTMVSAGQITGNLTGTVTGASSLNVLKAGDTMTGALSVTGAGGITSTFGVSAATGAFGGGICPSTASVCLNALPLAANAGAYFGGSVGIGTTAPEQRLSVAGSVSMTGNVISSGTGTNQFAGYIKTNTGASDTYIVAQNSGADNVLAGVEVAGGGTGADWIMFTNRSNLAGSQQSLGFYKIGGTAPYGTGVKMVHNGENLGIGTTLPVQKLDVAGSVSMTGNVISSGTGTNYFAGNLGVGNTAAARKVSVAGGVQVCAAAGCASGDGTYLSEDGTDGSIGNQRVGNFSIFARNDLTQGIKVQTNGSGSGNASIILAPNALYASTFTAATGGLALSGPLTSASFISAASKTAAQLEAVTPTAAGQIYYCSNCSNAVHVVVSTGSAVCQFDAFTGGTAWH